MTFRWAFASFTVVTLVLGVTAAQASDGPMDRFVGEVLARNPSLKARVQLRESARTNATAEGLLPDPLVSVMVDQVPNHGEAGEMPMIRYQVNQMVPWPGKLGLMRSAAERQAEQAGASEEQRKLDLVLEAKRGFLMLVLNRQRRDTNRVSYGLLTTIASTAAARYGAGTAGHHEVARAEVERNALEVERVALEGERASIVAMLNALRYERTDAPMADPAPFETPDPSLQVDRLVDAAVRQRPELRGMDAMRRENQAMADLARRERYPDFMVGAWFNQMIGEPDTVGAMVGFTVPIFGIARQGRRASALDLRSASATSDLDAMRAMIGFEIADASRKVATAARTVDFTRTVGVPRARESFEVALAAYATGTLELTGLLEARRALQTTELALAQAQVEHEAAIAELERALGGRLPEAGR
jgi:outer membrane protein TolC